MLTECCWFCILLLRKNITTIFNRNNNSSEKEEKKGTLLSLLSVTRNVVWQQDWTLKTVNEHGMPKLADWPMEGILKTGRQSVVWMLCNILKKRAGNYFRTNFVFKPSRYNVLFCDILLKMSNAVIAFLFKKEPTTTSTMVNFLAVISTAVFFHEMHMSSKKKLTFP